MSDSASGVDNKCNKWAPHKSSSGSISIFINMAGNLLWLIQPGIAWNMGFPSRGLIRFIRWTLQPTWTGNPSVINVTTLGIFRLQLNVPCTKLTVTPDTPWERIRVGRKIPTIPEQNSKLGKLATLCPVSHASEKTALISGSNSLLWSPRGHRSKQESFEFHVASTMQKLVGNACFLTCKLERIPADSGNMVTTISEQFFNDLWDCVENPIQKSHRSFSLLTQHTSYWWQHSTITHFWARTSHIKTLALFKKTLK